MQILRVSSGIHIFPANLSTILLERGDLPEPGGGGASVIIMAVLKSAKHGDGKIGDGKIFITPLEQCFRIRTGENGSTAI